MEVQHLDAAVPTLLICRVSSDDPVPELVAVQRGKPDLTIAHRESGDRLDGPRIGPSHDMQTAGCWRVVGGPRASRGRVERRPNDSLVIGRQRGRGLLTGGPPRKQRRLRPGPSEIPQLPTGIDHTIVASLEERVGAVRTHDRTEHRVAVVASEDQLRCRRPWGIPPDIGTTFMRRRVFHPDEFGPQIPEVRGARPMLGRQLV
jgi:hypothetical protein